MLVDWSGDEDVDVALAEVAYGSLECGESGLTGGFGRDAGLNFEVFAHDIYDVEYAVARIGSAVDAIELHLGELHGLAVEGGGLGRAVDHHGAEVAHAGVFEGSENHLVANAVGVAVGDAHFYFFVCHINSFLCRFYRRACRKPP